nr:MAG TPA: hypothetical protein [Caudoviricetes sp.]
MTINLQQDFITMLLEKWLKLLIFLTERKMKLMTKRS